MAKKRKEYYGEKGVRLPLSSGFTVLVKPLPPYYKDLMDDLIPLPEYPSRKIQLAAGDEIDWPYEPPAVELSSEHEDYPIYMKWKSVERKRSEIEVQRKRARQDFLISNCVKVKDGPANLYDQEWAHSVEAAFPGYTVPTHPGKRMLVFLKTQVILDTQEMEMIVELSTSPEVTMQGILTALQGFQSNMGEGGSTEGSLGDAGN